jgi:glycine C-acetyltransferase
VIVGDTALAIKLSGELFERGIYVSGFGFPVVPKGEARLRCQISAAHTRDELVRAVEAIAEVGQSAGVIAE